MERNYPLKKNSYESELNDVFYSIVDSNKFDINKKTNEKQNNKKVVQNKKFYNKPSFDTDEPSLKSDKQIITPESSKKIKIMLFTMSALSIVSIVSATINFVFLSELNKKVENITKDSIAASKVSEIDNSDESESGSNVSAVEDESDVVLKESSSDIVDNSSQKEILKLDTEREIKNESLHLASGVKQIKIMIETINDNIAQQHDYSSEQLYTSSNTLAYGESSGEIPIESYEDANTDAWYNNY